LNTAAIVLGHDLRDHPADLGIYQGWTGQLSLARLAEAVVLAAPQDRRQAVARAARDHCDGRYPSDESAYLAVLAFYALDDDAERAGWLVETAVPRLPGTVPLKRLVGLRARGEPLELMADQKHHQRALVAELVTPGVRQAHASANRRKLDDEVARILD
jgi:hypothetical protein